MNELAVLFLKGCFTLLGVYFLYCIWCYWQLHTARTRSRKTYTPYVKIITPQTPQTPQTPNNTPLPDPATWRKRALDSIQAIRDDPEKRRILINRLWPDREPTYAELESVLEPPPEDIPDLNEPGNPTEDPLPDHFWPTEWTPAELTYNKK